MDGAIVLDRDIARDLPRRRPPDARPHDPHRGDRHPAPHRRAGRASRPALPVISVSQSMQIIALYVGGIRYVLEDSGQILSRANQALATLERYKMRLDEVSGTLSALEIEDLVTVRDVAAVAQRLEMVRRIAGEIDGYVVELGTDGRLLSLQLDELVAGVEAERELVVRDYLPGGRAAKPRRGDPRRAGRALAHRAARHRRRGAGPRPRSGRALDAAVSPRGYRLLAKVPRLPGAVVDRLVEHFGGLQKLLARQHRRPAGGGRRRRAPGPQRPRGAVPAGRVQHPRALRLSARRSSLRSGVARRKPVSREQPEQLLAAMSPPHLAPCPRPPPSSRPWCWRGLRGRCGLALGATSSRSAWASCLVTVRVGDWVTSNCTSVGAEPKAAANTW